MISLLAIVGFSYLIGSVPTGFIFGKLLKGIDIRTTGSKSTGATNVMRLLGTKIGVTVLAIDILKGLIATLFISHINYGGLSISLPWLEALAGFSAVAGHIFPVWINFKGGKGVGTGAGLLLGLLPVETGFCLVVFIITVALTRYISLGSILAAVFVFVAVLAQGLILGSQIQLAHWLVSLVLVLVVLYTHRENINRLLAGQEHKLGVTT